MFCSLMLLIAFQARWLTCSRGKHCGVSLDTATSASRMSTCFGGSELGWRNECVRSKTKVPSVTFVFAACPVSCIALLWIVIIAKLGYHSAGTWGAALASHTTIAWVFKGDHCGVFCLQKLSEVLQAA